MKLTVLGGNGPFPAAGGACSSYLIEGNGVNILFDAGSGSLSNLMKIIDPVRLDCIVLSHLHWDHITDIPVLFYYLNVMGLKDRDIPNIPLYLPKTPVGEYKTIAGFSAFDTEILSDESKINIKGMTITAKSMTHPIEGYALKCECNDRTLVFSGDTTYNTDLMLFAAGCDLLIADSGFLEKQLSANTPHMSAAQCARTAVEAGVGRLLLSHLNPQTPVKAYLEEAQKIFKKTSAAALMDEIEV